MYGLTTNLSIKAAMAQNVLYVPIGAVYNQNGKQYVDVYTATGKINAKDISKYIKQVEVSTGISNFSYIEIKSGLNEGDVVMASSIGKGTANTGFTGSTGQQNTSNTESSSQTGTSSTGNFNRTRTSSTDGTSQTNSSNPGSTSQTSTSNTSSTNQKKY